ncbi:YidC/Oxa1 family membrane protein insertase [Cryobacterium aureum]|uniref:YidC/Oxa1 family membrane protein insertase n=1 Tax=Cryobacterium aureum TaxID=995037 RepID=UPI000CF42214
MSREIMVLYTAAGTHPLTSCLPLMLQAPVFLALFSGLYDAQQGKVGIGLRIKPLLCSSAAHSSSALLPCTTLSPRNGR